jgi:hypothetical protein
MDRMSHDELPKDVVQIMVSLLNRVVLGVLYIYISFSQIGTIWSMKELRLSMTHDELPKDVD